MALPTTQNSSIGNSVTDIVTSLQNAVQAANTIANALSAQVPSNPSGQLSVDTLIVPGFVRVTGVSVVVAGATGGLYDASSIATASATAQVFPVPAVAGFQAVNMVFANGLVYKPGAAQKAAFFYARV